MLTSLHNS